MFTLTATHICCRDMSEETLAKLSEEEREAVLAGNVWERREFHVKWKRYSYMHCTWETRLTVSQLAGYKRVLNYMKKMDDLEVGRLRSSGWHGCVWACFAVLLYFVCCLQAAIKCALPGGNGTVAFTMPFAWAWSQAAGCRRKTRHTLAYLAKLWRLAEPDTAQHSLQASLWPNPGTAGTLPAWELQSLAAGTAQHLCRLLCGRPWHWTQIACSLHHMHALML